VTFWGDARKLQKKRRRHCKKKQEKRFKHSAIMNNILIPNPEKLEELIGKIAQDGKEHFHVIADFDRTLTSAFVNGKPRP